VGSALGVAMMVSVVSVPVAVVVTALAQVPEEIALVPMAEVPLATKVGKVESVWVWVTVALVISAATI
jgi:hypothetical protein